MASLEKNHWIVLEIQKHPSITLEMLDFVISQYEEDLTKENTKYMTQMSDLHYQRSLTEFAERMVCGDRSTLFNDGFQDNVRSLTQEHESNLSKINQDLNQMHLIKQVFTEMYPEPIIKSPRLYKLVKSNSILKRSFELLIRK